MNNAKENGKKYEMCPDRKKLVYSLIDTQVHMLYQIRALKDFLNVKEGDFGGWVESESNLSQQGTCWIYPGVNVYHNAYVEGNGVIYPGKNGHLTIK